MEGRELIRVAEIWSWRQSLELQEAGDRPAEFANQCALADSTTAPAGDQGCGSIAEQALQIPELLLSSDDHGAISPMIDCWLAVTF